MRPQRVVTSFVVAGGLVLSACSGDPIPEAAPTTTQRPTTTAAPTTTQRPTTTAAPVAAPAATGETIVVTGVGEPITDSLVDAFSKVTEQPALPASEIFAFHGGNIAEFPFVDVEHGRLLAVDVNSNGGRTISKWSIVIQIPEGETVDTMIAPFKTALAGRFPTHAVSESSGSDDSTTFASVNFVDAVARFDNPQYTVSVGQSTETPALGLVTFDAEGDNSGILLPASLEAGFVELFAPLGVEVDEFTVALSSRKINQFAIGTTVSTYGATTVNLPADADFDTVWASIVAVYEPQGWTVAGNEDTNDRRYRYIQNSDGGAITLTQYEGALAGPVEVKVQLPIELL